MSTPMYDEPEHFPMGVNTAGEGPASDKEVDHIVCWCGREGCRDYRLSDLAKLLGHVRDGDQIDILTGKRVSE